MSQDSKRLKIACIAQLLLGVMGVVASVVCVVIAYYVVQAYISIAMSVLAIFEGAQSARMANKPSAARQTVRFANAFSVIFVVVLVSMGFVFGGLLGMVQSVLIVIFEAVSCAIMTLARKVRIKEEVV